MTRTNPLTVSGRRLLKDVQCIIQREMGMRFETIYITQYKAVLNGRGLEVYQMLTEAMRKMSLFMRPKAFNAKLELLCALSMCATDN